MGLLLALARWWDRLDTRYLSICPSKPYTLIWIFRFSACTNNASNQDRNEKRTRNAGERYSLVLLHGNISHLPEPHLRHYPAGEFQVLSSMTNVCHQFCMRVRETSVARFHGYVTRRVQPAMLEPDTLTFNREKERKRGLKKLTSNQHQPHVVSHR